jgi:hypothetical protein
MKHETKTNDFGVSEELIEHIAERAVDKALERIYTEVGRSVIRKVTWVFGVAALAIAAWLIGNNHIGLR